ncbi:hypothetical protein LSAT2_009096 [Lamellibrachia satsuma]|nr:hypothetical protein LSAT2_009096 [Lamellibrachia satsuma]
MMHLCLLQDGLLSAELMAEIAERYAADLKTHFTDVIHVLAELSKQSSHHYHSRSDHPGSQIFYGLFGLYSQIAPCSPPPLPARPCLYSYGTDREGREREHRSLACSPSVYTVTFIITDIRVAIENTPAVSIRFASGSVSKFANITVDSIDNIRQRFVAKTIK